MTITREKNKAKQNQHKVVPEVLIYEMMADGTSIYYQGYEHYLKGTKTAEFWCRKCNMDFFGDTQNYAGGKR